MMLRRLRDPSLDGEALSDGGDSTEARRPGMLPVNLDRIGPEHDVVPRNLERLVHTQQRRVIVPRL